MRKNENNNFFKNKKKKLKHFNLYKFRIRAYNRGNKI